GQPAPPEAWPDIVAVIPARDEAEVIGATLTSLFRQDYPGELRVVLVDDQSRDATAETARAAAFAVGAADRLTVISGRPLPSGWNGKVWAMQQGAAHVDIAPRPTSSILFKDADISYGQDEVRDLVERAEAQGSVLASLMVKLRCDSL